MDYLTLHILFAFSQFVILISQVFQRKIIKLHSEMLLSDSVSFVGFS